MLAKRSARLGLLAASAVAIGMLSTGIWPLHSAAAVPATQPAEPSPTTQSSDAAATTQPIDPAISALVNKLGDPDPTVRDEATRKLTEIGKAALPALHEAAECPDPEIANRAKEIARHEERRIPPTAPANHGMMGVSISSSVSNGVRTVNVDEHGQKTHIVRQADGSIEMTVSGVDEAGREATEVYKARNADELKKENPEAFALYDRWAGDHGGPGGIQMHMRVFGQLNGLNGAGAGANMPPILIRPMGPNAAGQNNRPIPPEIRARIEQQLRAANVPEEQRNRILKGLDDADAQQRDAQEKVHQHLLGKTDEARPETGPAQTRPAE